MRIYGEGEREQELIDRVVAEAEQRSQHLTEIQRQKLIELAKEYKDLGEFGVTIIWDALQNLQELSQSNTDTLKTTLERQLLPQVEMSEEEEVIIEGEATQVTDVELALRKIETMEEVEDE